MKKIYYSLAALGNVACERQWRQSIRSLRRHNSAIPVDLIVWGAPATATLREAARLGVRVIPAGSYGAAFAHLPPLWAQVLKHNPTLHKILALRYCPTSEISQLMYLDCDTFFFGDVAMLFDLYRGRHFFAREEPNSSRSHFGYDASYVDEELLRRLTGSEGLAYVPPFNTGIFLMNGGLWNQLRALAADFLVYAWRLTVGLAYASPLGAKPDDVPARLLKRVTNADQFWRLPYPSSNPWIVEEIALWVTLGRIAGLTHGAFRREHVIQNGEILELGPRTSTLPIIAHYYSSWEERFFEHLWALQRQSMRL